MRGEFPPLWSPRSRAAVMLAISPNHRNDHYPHILFLFTDTRRRRGVLQQNATVPIYNSTGRSEGIIPRESQISRCACSRIKFLHSAVNGAGSKEVRVTRTTATSGALVVRSSTSRLGVQAVHPRREEAVGVALSVTVLWTRSSFLDLRSSVASSATTSGALVSRAETAESSGSSGGPRRVVHDRSLYAGKK